MKLYKSGAWFFRRIYCYISHFALIYREIKIVSFSQGKDVQMKFKLFIPILIAALIISAWTPAPVNWNTPQENSVQAAAATLQLVINNKTGATVNLSLKGPAGSYTWTVKSGKSTFSVASGQYKYSYKACDKQVTGTVNVKKNGQVLSLPACSKKGTKAAGTVNVKVRNNTGGYVQLNLTGPATYTFSIAPGSSTINVIKGKYQYTAWGCGGSSISGTKQLGGGSTWTWWCL
jgi:hypothetical protein